MFDRIVNSTVLVKTLFSLIFLYTGNILATPTETTGYLQGADNNKLFYRHYGFDENRKTIVFIHGGPGFDSSDGGPELQDLASKYNFIMYDQRGAGYSEIFKNKKLITLERHIADIESVRKHFKLDSIILIGLSWGSGLASVYTGEYPHRVEKLVLLAPMPIRHQMLTYRYLHTTARANSEEAKRYQALRDADLSNATDAEVMENCRQYIKIMLKPYLTKYTDKANSKGDAVLRANTY